MAGRLGQAVALVALTSAVFAGAPASAGAGEIGEPPAPGSTFRGTAPHVKIDLLAFSPDPDGGMQLRVAVALECDSKKRVPAGLDDQVGGLIEPDGTFDIDTGVAGEPEGFQTAGRMRLRGAFTDTGLDGTISYKLVETDDDDNLVDKCNVAKMPVDYEAGPMDEGAARVQAAIPIGKSAGAHYQAVSATSSTHVFVAMRQDALDSPPFTTLLLRIDPATNEVDERRTVDGDFWGLVSVDDRLFGIDAWDGNVVPIDPKTLRAGEPISIAPGDDHQFELSSSNIVLWPRGASLDGSLWVSASRDQEIVRIDPVSGQVVGRIPLDRHPTDLAAGPAGLYAAAEGEVVNINVGSDDALVRVDPATMAVAASAPSIRNLEGVVADATLVAMSDQSPDGLGLVTVDPIALTPLTGRTEDEPTPLLAASPGIWGIRYGGDRIVALDQDLADVVEVVRLETGDGAVQASSGFGSIWVYDEGLRLLYRIATG